MDDCDIPDDATGPRGLSPRQRKVLELEERIDDLKDEKAYAEFVLDALKKEMQADGEEIPDYPQWPGEPFVGDLPF